MEASARLRLKAGESCVRNPNEEDEASGTDENRSRGRSRACVSCVRERRVVRLSDEREDRERSREDGEPGEHGEGETRRRSQNGSLEVRPAGTGTKDKKVQVRPKSQETDAGGEGGREGVVRQCLRTCRRRRKRTSREGTSMNQVDRGRHDHETLR